LHAAFAVAPDAVAAALDAKRRLTREDWVLPEPLKVRMGLHTGWPRCVTAITTAPR